MSLFLYPVYKNDLEGVKGAPNIYCSYGDMSTLQNFMFWMNLIELDSNGCSFDTHKLKDELDYCTFHKQEVIESIKEEYAIDKSYAGELIELFNRYMELLKFAVDCGYGLRWS